MIKRSFVLLLASLITLSLLAADITSRLIVSLSSNNNYELLIDGMRYHGGSNHMYLKDLRSGRHTIQVYALQRGTRRNYRPVHTATFILRQQYNMHITIDRNGYVHFDETRINNRYENGQNDRYDSNEREWDDHQDRDWNSREERYDNNRDWKSNENRWEVERAMSDYDYNSLLQQVRNQWMGSSKYNTTKDAVMRYYFNTQQVRGLLELLPSESQRLEIAKLAYRQTIDTHNYSLLYNLFSRNAKIELDRYIRSNRY